ncbi:MAG: adenylyltransferase/cytidyltransferase family protein [Candidatus Pacebacteria bacterium]|nr:adenylyltransferase/cytidyltransferase family protein [Candidatus Paceibacterota bacterium]
MTQYNLPLPVKQLIAASRVNKRKLVLVTGVFDLLHREHLRFLQKAKAAGDLLLVGLESDERVRAIKGPDRPVNDEQTRLRHLSNVEAVDQVFLLPVTFNRPEQHRALLREIRPDVLAVSSHTPHLEEKKEIVERVGGELRVVHQHNPDISTTKLLGQNG